MAKVALVRCESYGQAEVTAAVRKGVGLLGGPGAFARRGEKILLKPNWLSAEEPEKCVTTHPSVFAAAVEALRPSGAVLSYGDSPAFHSPETAARKTGFHAAAEGLGVPLADFRSGREIFFKEGVQNRKFTIANGVLDSGGIVSLPKLKTHGFLKLTGSVKNQFGCIPGALKGEFHIKLTDPAQFAQMLVDLNLFLKPRLFIMDGVMAMEGNGPRSGRPRKLNVLVFSADPVALDATVCRIINVDPALSLTVTAGYRSGLGVYKESDIEIVGDGLESFFDGGFDASREPVRSLQKGKGIWKWMNNAIVPKPVINGGKCVRCGICVNMCPVSPKAVDWHGGDKTKPPSYLYYRCIRCYCCQEVCPEGAIELKSPWIRKLFGQTKTKRPAR